MNCLECGTKIVGRSDKKFCNDDCRNTYNNKIHKDSINLMRNIHNRLRKNHHLLSQYDFKDGKAITYKLLLATLGFNFDYFTQLKTYKNGAEYRYIYDIGYKFLEEDKVLLVKND